MENNEVLREPGCALSVGNQRSAGLRPAPCQLVFILARGCGCVEVSGWTPLGSDSKGTMDRYLGFILLVLLSAGTVGAMIAMSQWLGPRRKSRIHDMPFECGEEPAAIKRGRC